MSVRFLVGDVREKLAELPDEHFDCVVSSPPYWGLRNYDCDGQIGLEPTLAEHLTTMVEVFREVRRVLKPTGTLWLNYGDSYATTPNGRSAADTKTTGHDDRTFRDKPFSTIPKRSGRSGNLGSGGSDDVRRNASIELIKPKDLLMLPNRLAIALCDDGWWVRAECIWGKPNAMPDSSGSQRPSSAHEKVFMLTKSADADVWRARDTKELSFNPDLSERCPLVTNPERLAARWTRIGAYYNAEAVLQGRTSDEDAATYRGDSYVGGVPGPRKVRGNTRRDSFARVSKDSAGAHGQKPQFRDDREPVSYPRGAGRFLRNYEPAPLTVWEIAVAPFSGAHFATFPAELALRCLRAGCPANGSVLDPFGGAGTVGMVAARLGLDCTLIELNPGYVDIAQARLRAALAEVEGAETSRQYDPDDLFGALNS